MPAACSGCSRKKQSVMSRLTDSSGHTLKFIPPTEVHEDSRLVVFGEMGGSEEAKAGTPFIGPSGRAMRAALWKLKLRVKNTKTAQFRDGAEEQVVFTNTILCRAGSNVFPGEKLAVECLTRHQLSRSDKFGSLPWLACGANAVEALTGYRLPVLKARGSWLPVRSLPDKWVLATFHPAYLVRGAGQEAKGQDQLTPLLSVDANRAITGGGPVAPRVFYDDLKCLVDFRRDRPKVVSFDIEGGGGRPNLIGFAWKEDEVWVLHWSEAAKKITSEILHNSLPIAHNASYDVPELREAGITPPTKWVDTINLAALYDPSLPMNLQQQVLTHVPGSTAWKGLVDHTHGPDYEGKQQKLMRGLWTEILTRLKRDVPCNGQEWYMFYNGLDTAWTLSLANQLRTKLAKQGRYTYYRDLMMPLQVPLQDLGDAGIPFDPERIEVHAEACKRLVRMATGIVSKEGNKMLLDAAVGAALDVRILLRMRRESRRAGVKKFLEAKILTTARGRFRALKARYKAGFNIDSPQQKAQLLGTWLGLPLPNTEKGNATTSDKHLENLLKRMLRIDLEGAWVPTVKSKRVPQEEAVRIITAILAGTKWGHWEKTFLRP